MHTHPQEKADDLKQGTASADWPTRSEQLARALEALGQRVMSLEHIEALSEHANPLEGVAPDERDVLQTAIIQCGTGNQVVGLAVALGADLDVAGLPTRVHTSSGTTGLTGAHLGRALPALLWQGSKLTALELANLYAQSQARDLVTSIPNKAAAGVVTEVAGICKGPLDEEAVEAHILQACVEVVLACEMVAPGQLTASDWDKLVGELTRLLKGADHPALQACLHRAIAYGQVPAIVRLLEAEPGLNLTHPMDGESAAKLHALLTGGAGMEDEEGHRSPPCVEEIIRLCAAGVPQLRTEWLDDAVFEAGTPDQSLRWLQVMGRHGDRELVQMNAHQHRVLRSGDPDLIEALQEVPGVNAREVQALAAVLRSTRTTKHWHH